MSDEDTGATPPGRGTQDDGREDRQVVRTWARGRRSRSPGPDAADPGTSLPAAWLDDEDGIADRAAHPDEDLVSLGFLRAALRRSRRLWVGLAVLGLLFGVAFSMTRPPTPQASTTLQLNVGPEGQPGTAILNDQVIAESPRVAELALHMPGMPKSIGSLVGTYKAKVLTDQFLQITASAPSSGQAVKRANAIATAFLTFRAQQLNKQQNLYFAKLDATLTNSERQYQAINAKLADQATSHSQQALEEEKARALSALIVLKQQVATAKSASRETTAAMVGQSSPLDPATPVAESRLKPLILFSGAGAVIGLFLGAGFIFIRALVSDRLRRRDDVAIALGAPVRLSTPARRGSRWRPRRRGLAAAKGRDVRRVVAFLRTTMPTESGHGALAVVPVDDTRVAALSVVKLAAALAQEDARVIVADLCRGTPAAKLVGCKGPGVHTLQVDGAQIDVAIPDPDEIAPVGPFDPTGAPGQDTFGGQVAAAYASADVLLTLMALDPSLVGDHLRTWAADAVVVVTAGRSSWTKIHAVGELIRLGGTRLISAVLIGADKWDDSLGATATRAAGRHGTPAGNGSADATGLDDASMPRFMRR